MNRRAQRELAISCDEPDVDGPAKVSAVAADVGYGSEAAFSRAFKRFTGASPAQWRAGAGRGYRNLAPSLHSR